MAAVVETVSVPVAAPLVTLTGEVAPKLNVGASTAPAGLVVRAAVRVTLPVNPPLGVIVIVVVLPVVAPGELMVIAPLLATAKLAGATKVVTAMFKVVVVVVEPEVPVTVTTYAPAVVVVVEVTVSVPFCAALPLIVTAEVTPQVTGLVAPAGAVVTAQLKFTAPVNPLEGVTVMLAVFPVVAPASKLMPPPFDRANPGTGAEVTVTVLVPVALL